MYGMYHTSNGPGSDYHASDHAMLCYASVTSMYMFESVYLELLCVLRPNCSGFDPICPSDIAVKYY